MLSFLIINLHRLEWQVVYVVHCGGCRSRYGRGLRSIGGLLGCCVALLGSTITLLRSAATLLTLGTTAQELHLVGQNLGRVALVAALVGPLAGAKATLDVELRAFAHKTVYHVGKVAPQGDGVPLGVVGCLFGVAVVETLACCQPHSRGLHTAFEGTNFGVYAHITNKYYFVYHDLLN